MKWEKLGRVFCPKGEREWMNSHAAVPIAENFKTGTDLVKVYFSSRDKNNKSSISWLIFDIKEPERILELCEKPLLQSGELGTFDDSGVMTTCLVKHGEDRYLYYIGWNLGVTVPFRNSTGLAISRDGSDFVKMFEGPIIDRTAKEPHFNAGVSVLPSIDIWRMWYLSCTGWTIDEHGKPKHSYHIKYAESIDGIQWKRDGIVAIDFKDENEYAISQPSVIRDDDGFKMWFSSRGDKYRIRYAESVDGINWIRIDEPLEVGIDVSLSGWDSDMIEYPCVFDHNGRKYMLYNGNDYGKTGFGLAVEA